MLAEFLFQFVEFAVRTAILLGLLWLMIKLQKLDRKFDYKFSGLLGMAALASGLDMIPYVGHPLAVLVLLVGVKKVSQVRYNAWRIIRKPKPSRQSVTLNIRTRKTT